MLKATAGIAGRIGVKCGTWKLSGILLALVAVSPGLLRAQNVTTLTPPQQTNFSGDLSVTGNGDILVADYGVLLNNANGRTVWRVTTEGQFSIFAQGFSGASGNTLDADGNFFQSNIAASRIDRVTPAGVRSTFASGVGVSNPVGLAHDSQGNLYVANCGNNTIQRFTPDGVGSLFSGALQLSCPNGLTIDDEDTLYAANFNNGSIVRLPQDGPVSILAQTPSSSSKPAGGNGHIIFGNGRLYVVSNATHQVFELLLDGTLNLIAGSGIRGRADGPLLQAQFSLPNGIGLSPDGAVLYVNDSEGLQSTIDIAPNVIRVIPLPNIEAPFNISSGLNDAWFNAATPGQGFFITVFEDIGMMFVAWFTYESERPDASVMANLGEPGHRWLTAFGPYVEDTATLDIEITSGGVFDAATPMPAQDADGTLEIEFSDCENALLSYDITSPGLQGSIPLSRIALDNVPSCEKRASEDR